jgi:SAM-dependent methyltransferase
MSSSYRMELDKFLNNLVVNADVVLDIGGSQLPLPKRVKSFKANQYLIADLPEPHADSPKPDYEIDLNKHFDLEFRADLVVCLEVFDYVWNPAEAFDNIERHLKPGGQAIISFPFMYPTHQPIDDDALRYTEGGIKKLADYAGLRITKIVARRPESQAIEFLWRNERMRAAKHYDHNVTGWIVMLEKA